jgi:hypothetical protein
VFHCEKEGAIIGPARGPWLGAVEINVDTDLVSVEILIGGTFEREENGGTVDVLHDFVETDDIISAWSILEQMTR